ncbi:hypothetical protein BXY66_0571 [Shimia isoporae]|uniref:Uncharacterized protein n=1 Tax=Shimia isoporae TaxID=647720 RepID=A0A4R1NK02_9RHOB|nr:hypothetical protein [Shimia isoporae]TCL08534.1 hypothetical protein BXY66_0571 [Shimia isoporae]
MKTTVAILSLLLAASAAQANGLANRAAKIFEQACLSEPVLSLGKGSNAADGALAASYAGSVFAQYDANGTTMGLRGKPTYSIGSPKTEGSFKCYVASKDLTAQDVVKKFNRLKKVAGNGQRPTYVGPAKWDDVSEDYDRYIEGKRAEFQSEGRKLQLELYHFISDHGPVGALFLTLEHKVSQ